MTTPELLCWKCSGSLENVLVPFSRLARCEGCKVELHVCRMCEFFDTTVSNSCREPIAEKVNDKNRANFCGYFQPGTHRQANSDMIIDANKESLEGLFGLKQGTTRLSTGDVEQSRQELDSLFGLDDKKQD